MSHAGSCACGELKMTFHGEPVMKALCHCSDCKKISGSAFSTNIGIKEADVELSGPSKTWAKTADSGKVMTTTFCPSCGTNMCRKTDTFPGVLVVKAGIFDDLTIAKPDVELYAKSRAPWLEKLEGTQDVDGMP